MGILGSGIMGTGLTEVAARAGFQAVVRSRSRSAADAMFASMARGLAKQVQRGKLSASEHDEILGRVTATDQLDALSDCDLVIESVVEDLDVKRTLFAELDRIVKPSAILATNTSTLPVVNLAVATGRPEQVCGVHFFNPAAVMKLVEIVRPLTASDATIATATSFAVACGKDTVEVQDRAGFIVNALLFPYLNNAVRLAEQGTAQHRRHRHRDEGWLQLPDGTVRAAWIWWAWTRRSRSSTLSTKSSAIPITLPFRCCGGWLQRANSGARRAAGSSRTAVEPPVVRRADRPLVRARRFGHAEAP